jgi:ComF family protein
MINDFIQLLFPNACVVCNATLHKDLNTLCVACSDDLPEAPMFFNTPSSVQKMFYGRLALEYGVALLTFEKKGTTQKLMHQLKYRGDEQISGYLGEWMAYKILKTDWHNTITAVVPVPIHPKRKKKRGYNQVTQFGKAIAAALNVPYKDEILIKTGITKTQVFKKRIARWGQLDNTLTIADFSSLKGQHVLLVDDIITTGATIEACGAKLLEIEGLKLSVASMAITL